MEYGQPRLAKSWKGKGEPRVGVGHASPRRRPVPRRSRPVAGSASRGSENTFGPTCPTSARSFHVSLGMGTSMSCRTLPSQKPNKNLLSSFECREGDRKAKSGEWSPYVRGRRHSASPWRTRAPACGGRIRRVAGTAQSFVVEKLGRWPASRPSIAGRNTMGFTSSVRSDLGSGQVEGGANC